MPDKDRHPHDKPGVIFWFRHDLRLHDQLALELAVDQAQRLGGWLLPIYVHDERLHAPTPWGFPRMGKNRAAWIRMAVNGLSAQLTALGSTLIEANGDPARLLANLVRALDNPLLVCEELPAPEEQNQIETLRRDGVKVDTVWQSTLMAPQTLPCLPKDLPDQFTSFRQILERNAIRATPPSAAVKTLPCLPADSVMATCRAMLPVPTTAANSAPPQPDQRTSFPWNQPHFHAGETAALAHLDQYCRRGLPHAYKSTRNGLTGVDYSSKWSPWLATGALSARMAWAAICEFEASQGASESTYWLHFELLWRDHFRWLHCKHGRKLYAAGGLADLPASRHNDTDFQKWCRAETGNAFIDAGMKELALTGYLSNRMRQNVASYLIHDMACDWRAGAAWFEACLIDYDVYSNQGNWLYLSGRGTDPRANRRFNTLLQANTYDPHSTYRQLWANPSSCLRDSDQQMLDRPACNSDWQSVVDFQNAQAA